MYLKKREISCEEGISQKPLKQVTIDWSIAAQSTLALHRKHQTQRKAKREMVKVGNHNQMLCYIQLLQRNVDANFTLAFVVFKICSIGPHMLTISRIKVSPNGLPSSYNRSRKLTF